MIRHVSWGILLLLVTGWLAACGFHLRGLSESLAPLPFRTLMLDAPQATITPYLNTTLAADPRIVLVTSAKAADAVLQVVDEVANKDILSINRTGTINQYQLTYRVTFHLLVKGSVIGPDIVLTTRRELNYSDQAVLGKTQEEELLWNDMRRDTARMLLYRLSILGKMDKRPTSAPMTTQHANP